MDLTTKRYSGYLVYVSLQSIGLWGLGEKNHKHQSYDSFFQTHTLQRHSTAVMLTTWMLKKLPSILHCLGNRRESQVLVNSLNTIILSVIFTKMLESGPVLYFKEGFSQRQRQRHLLQYSSGIHSKAERWVAVRMLG